VSNWRRISVWEVSTIAIPWQRLLERRAWNYGDIQRYSSIGAIRSKRTQPWEEWRTIRPEAANLTCVEPE